MTRLRAHRRSVAAVIVVLAVLVAEANAGQFGAWGRSAAADVFLMCRIGYVLLVIGGIAWAIIRLIEGVSWFAGGLRRGWRREG
jgi:hypothetical protein